MSGRLTHAAMALLTSASLLISPVYTSAQNTPTPAAAAPAAGQTPPVQASPPPARALNISGGPDYSKGPRWFPNFSAPYMPIHVPTPILANSPRIGQLITSGMLTLSLDDAISLALENNLDIAVERYTPWLDQANLLLAKSGVNGKTIFDPSVTSSMYLEEQTIPVNNPFFAGVGAGSAVAAIIQHATVANFAYTQGFHTGTQVQVTFDNTRSSTTSSFNSFNPSVASSLEVQLTQPLLNGFGRLVNTRYILEAKNTVKVGESQFEQQVMTTVSAVANAYWELVYARENVKVEQAAVAVSQKLYDDNKKQLEIGTMAPLDVLTAESQLATDQQNLIVAQTVQLQDHTTLLNTITKDPLTGPLAGVEIVPTTPISAPDVTENISIQDAVNEAWQKRPELQQAALNLKNADVEVKATKNGLLPTLNLYGFYDSQGLDGTRTIVTTTPLTFAPNLNAPVVDATGTPIPGSFESLVRTFSATKTVVPGGIGDAWDQLVHSKFPIFEGGINLTLPVRNRAAQAANATAQLNQREQDASYRRLQNSIFLSVRNAQIALVQGRAQVGAAEKARTLAQQTLDDEEKKYQLGSSTSYNVVLRSRDLTTAEGTELRARINLIEAAVNFNQAVGRTLEVHNISLADAMNGTVSRQPNIPGTPDVTAPPANK
ncbi:MAG TPA: TolC family protein [Candidatus Acidoferrales bacterium]|nr:TolC family protein [Candidatus Acidoferrales bacterium]